MKSSSRYPWVVVTIFFFFTLLHQADKLLIGPLTENIIKDFILPTRKWVLYPQVH